ncbi:hypothetical protein CRG98_020150 [Punica granatum]|uniref:Uncharacterized protein n=1 Tax=Punica granatum TaxID=22663 RepID=A0A2I0JU82_PUNGR|nr:hypothetical protein CRG98_020150 [Punica granatum]
MSAAGVVKLPGDCLTSIHALDPSGLPHRHCLEQGGESGLDPIPHSGCERSINNNANYRIYGKRIEIPKVDEMGHANETCTRTGCPFLSIDRGVSVSLTPRISADHEMTVMPLGDPNRYSWVDWQTRLAVRLVGDVPVDREGIFVRGQLRWIPKRLRIAPAVILGGEHV